VRLATFNVLHGRSPADDRVDVERFAAAITELDADVLGLQEVDRAQPRSHGADLTAIAAAAGGFVDSRFVPALVGEPGQWRPATGTEDDDTPSYGVSLLSRHPVTDWRVVRLPALQRRVPLVFKGPRAAMVTDEPRVAVVAVVDGPGGPLTVVATHLSFIPAWNVVQLRHLLREVGSVERLVVMGDLNLRPRRAARATGLRALAVAPTFPAHAPRVQIDHLLARGEVVPRTLGGAVRLPLSDHCALTVSLEDGG
jgi:endonuclease/exonuclease/phosphatase family metal-dependent hydrolase